MKNNRYIIIDGEKISFSELEKKSIDELREIKNKINDSLSIVKNKLKLCDSDERKHKLFFVKNKIGESLNFVNDLISVLKKYYKPIPEYFMEAAQITLDKDQFDFILLNAKDRKNADLHNKILD